MSTVERNVTGVILVGGKSRRMGIDKAFLEVDGIPLIERVLTAFGNVFARTLLVGNGSSRFARYGLPCHDDIIAGSALGGLYTGLVRAETPYIFVAPCDLPYPSSAVIRHLLALREGFDAVVPFGPAGHEPLFAVYGQQCREPIRRQLEGGKRRIYDVYAELNVNYVGMETLTALEGGDRTFINLNTPEEYDRHRRSRQQ